MNQEETDEDADLLRDELGILASRNLSPINQHYSTTQHYSMNSVKTLYAVLERNRNQSAKRGSAEDIM